MPTITKLDFVAVPSSNAERSRAFYGETLGLRRDAHLMLHSRYAPAD